MLISIIIPVYNVERYLSQCLDSVLNQSYDGDYEVICVDDGSTDGSPAILEEYAGKSDKIKIIRQENRGLGGARNMGLRAARGRYVWFVDSDDWIEQEALATLAKSIGDEDIVCFNGRRYFEDGTVEIPDSGIEEGNLTGWEYYGRYALSKRNFHFVCVVLRIYRREFLLADSLFFEEGIYHEDNLFTPIVCYYAASVRVIPDILYVYRIRQGSITQSFTDKRIFDTIKVANRLAEFFIPKTDIDKSVVYRDIATYYPNVLYLLKKYGSLYSVEYFYSLFDLKIFKLISQRFPENIFYFLLKYRIPLIYQYPFLVKIMKNLKLM